MKKTGLLHSEISHVIAKMGHRDSLVIGDCGLPIPAHVQRIDLALTAGVPGFMETLRVVLTELQVEEAWIAAELSAAGGPIYSQFMETIGDVPVQELPHEGVKKLIAERAVAVIRTGESTPYANVILQSGVTF